MKNNLIFTEDIRNTNARFILDFMGNFNTIYSFINNLDSIFSSGSSSNETLDQVLNNQALLNQLNNQLVGMDGKLSQIIRDNQFNQDSLNGLIELSGSQTVMLAEIKDYLGGIQNTLNTYLPAIMGQLSQISRQNSIIMRQLNIAMLSLYNITNQLDEINTNVILNSVMTEFIPSYQRIKYISERFDTLVERLNPEEKMVILERGTSRQENETIFNNEMVELTEFSESLVNPNIDDLLFHLTTFGDVASGDTLVGRSGIEIIGDFLYANREYGRSQESEVAWSYQFLSSLLLLQVKAYGALLACRNILGYPYYNFTSELDESVTKQIEVFREKQLKKYDSFVSTNYIENRALIEKLNVGTNQVKFKADPGYVVTGMEFLEEDNGTLSLDIYQAKIVENYAVDSTTLSTVKYNNVQRVFYYHETGMPSGRTRNFMPYMHVMPEGYVITELEFGVDRSTVGFMKSTGSKYNPETGEINEKDQIITNTLDDSSNHSGVITLGEEYTTKILEKSGKLFREDGVPIGLLMDTVLAPLKGIGAGYYIYNGSHYIQDFIADSYLKEQLLSPKPVIEDEGEYDVERNPVADTYVSSRSYDVNNNYGREDKLNVSLVNDWNISYLKFLLYGISPNINSAKIYLTIIARNSPQSQATHAAELVDNNWNEYSVTWNNKPSVAGTIATWIVPGVGNTVEIDVTKQVKDALAKGETHLSIRITPKTTGSSPLVSYASRERNTIGSQPVLICSKG